MEKLILDPGIPYIGPIYGGKFSPGRMVRIQGTIPSVAYRFNINLQCGPSIIPHDDTAIQIAIKLLDGFISLNSLQNGTWGHEQTHNNTLIKRAEKFELIILCEFNRYKVAINGQHFTEFPQRIHYDRITHLAIDGDVSIVQISYEDNPSSRTPSDIINVDDFEMIDSNTVSKTPSFGINVPLKPGISQPPSYHITISNNQGASAPYATDGAPYPSGGAPYPFGGGGTPYPTGVPGVISTSPVPPPGAPGIPYPPPNAPIPLNAGESSNFRTAKRNYEKTWFECIGISIIAGIGITILLLFSHGI